LKKITRGFLSTDFKDKRTENRGWRVEGGELLNRGSEGYN
jgi:hypothetical protein